MNDINRPAGHINETKRDPVLDLVKDEHLPENRGAADRIKEKAKASNGV